MPNLITPKEYSPEFCASVISSMHESLRNALDMLSQASTGQNKLTLQSIQHIEDSFKELKDDIKKLQDNPGFDEKVFAEKIAPIVKSLEDKIDTDFKKTEAIEQSLDKFRVTFYASGVTALVFLLGFAFTLFKMLQTALSQTGV